MRPGSTTAAVSGIAIERLFAVMRSAARKASVEGQRGMARELATMRQATQEQVSRQANLNRMRGLTTAHLRGALAERGVSPMMTMSAGDPEMATYVAQAAASPSRQGSMSMRGIGMY